MSLETDTDAILDPLIASFSGALQTSLEGELVSVYVAGDAQMVSWAGLPFEGPPTKAAVDFAKKRSATLIKDLDTVTRERLRTTISNGDGSHSNAAPARRIQTLGGWLALAIP